MKVRLICSGFGGQGALTIGKFLAKASMKEGKEVTWLPSYGPAMRGGTANCSVIFSDEEIASPIVNTPDVVIALNQPSVDKFEPLVVKGGVLIVNSDMCPNGTKRKDIRVIEMPMSRVASDMGSMKIVNMLAIGIFIEATKVVKHESVEEDLVAFMGEKNPDLLELNMQAIKKGMEFAKE